MKSFDQEFISPTYTDTINQAAALCREGRLQEAERLCLDILGAASDDFDALLLLGILKLQQGSREGALLCFDQALRGKPKSYEALYNRGVTLQALKRDGDAIDSYDQALSVKPDCTESLNNRGNALQALKRHSEAIDSYDRALMLKPDYAEALNNRGNALQALRRYSEAIVSYDKALILKPAQVEFLNHRGATLQALRRCGEALDSYERALSLKPDYAEALSNRGVTLQALQRNSEAMRSYDKALTLKLEYADALWNKSLLLLLLGEFDKGWALYEWRWKRTDAPAATKFSEPLWLGLEDITGKRLLLHAEQGLGDAIQFSRYAKMVASRGATVVLAVPKPLKMLLRNIEGASEVIAGGDPSPQYDFHCPLMSLPLVFKTSLATIPCEIPYLEAEQKSIAKWSAKLGAPDRLRVGLVWSGGTELDNDQNRSISLPLLSPLFDLPVDWICLQKEIRPVDRAELARLLALRYFEAQIEDFSDTAALIELCDLVISVDTAVAHLAGAMGKPLWLFVPFSPDWRWLLDREDSPWYSTARLFRQPALGDWGGPINRVTLEIESLLESFCGDDPRDRD